MNKRYFIPLIPLFVLIVIGFLSGDVYPIGHYKDLGGPGGTLADCDVCHDFAGGYYNNPPSYNLRWVRSNIVWPPATPSKPVWFINFSGAPNTGILADATTPINGPCEVCHTTTTYYNKTGTGVSHFPGANCTGCHPHFADDIINYFEPRFIGTQSHITHWDDPKGPQLGGNTCSVCHDPYFTRNGNGKALFADGQPLTTTTICDPCHSKAGAFDGVDDSVIGAKPNWTDGAYKPAPSGYPTELQDGKEDWCAGCHDNGISRINNVSAPNVMGNNTTYGYNINGHGYEGVLCKDCHDFTLLHTDGNKRTYAASALPNNYRAGYRLNEDMAVPRNGEIHPEAFRLCTRCHDYAEITGTTGYTSNFRDDAKARQYHDMHLNWWPAFICADSDFDGVGCSSGTCKDSATTCINCHNVHGALGNNVMIRHGELISTPGTSDKVPALDFHWYKADGVTQTTVFEESRYGGLLCGLSPDVSYNHVCLGCHATGELKWYRIPGGPLGVTVEAVWTSDYSNVPKTVFKVYPLPDNIRYHVRFKIAGPGSYYVGSPGKKSKAFATSGTYWETKLPDSDTLTAGTYEWTWDKSIPSTATPGSNAQVTIKINMFNAPGGTLLSTSKKSATFRIAP